MRVIGRDLRGLVRYPRAVHVIALAWVAMVTTPAAAEAGEAPAEVAAEVAVEEAAESSVDTPTGRARLRGQVLVYGSRDVVFGARVLGATADLVTVTDADGRFEMWMPPGQHVLVIRASGFRDLPITVTLADGQDLV